MSPKPGFYYYDGKRAMHVYLLLAVFGLGVYLSKYDLPTADEVFNIFISYLIRGLIALVLATVLILLVKFIVLQLVSFFQKLL